MMTRDQAIKFMMENPDIKQKYRFEVFQEGRKW